MENSKRKYVKPKLISHGSIEEVTGWTGGGAGEFFGGNQSGHGTGAIPFHKHGPAGNFSG
jgi:hypothetical protein